MAPMTSNGSVRTASSRPKPQLSCRICRAWKLRCDRRQPCSNCVKEPRNDCIYLPNSNLNNSGLQSRTFKSTRHEDRISSLERRLEKVVAALEDVSDCRKHHDNTATEAPRAAFAGSDTTLHYGIEPSRKRLVNSSNWEGLLEQITCIQRDISSIHSFSPEVSVTSTAGTNENGPRLLFAGHEDVTVEELRFLTVARPVAEALLDIVADDAHARWIFILLHGPTFRREVFTYWQNPMNADLVWLSMYYSALSIASHIVSRSSTVINELPNPARVSYLCLTRAAQCLRESDYTTPSAQTVSAMMLYLACEHNWANAHFRASIVLGVTVRLALKLGYHRDPSWYPKMTLYQGEMRRRSWALLKQLDHLISQKCGLPRLIDDTKTDTRLPRNILDEDLNPDMLILPPSCSDDMPTAIAVLNHKSRVFSVHGRITDQMHNVQPVSYENVLELEQCLKVEVEKMPTWLKTFSTTHSGNTAGDQRNAQIEVDIIVQSARMALHHRYLVPAYTDPKYADSRRACLGAAQRCLLLQRLLFEACGLYTDGRRMNWRLISLVGHDFLFAALLLCLDIYQLARSDGQFPSLLQIMAIDTQEQIEHLRLLRQAQDIWSIFGEHHSSGQEAAAILGTLLKGFESLPQLASCTNDRVALSASQHKPIEDVRGHTDGMLDARGALSPKYDQIGTNPVWTPSFEPTSMDYSQLRETQFQKSWFPDVPNSDFAQIQSMLNESQIDFDWNGWNEGMRDSDVEDIFTSTWSL